MGLPDRVHLATLGLFTYHSCYPFTSNDFMEGAGNLLVNKPPPGRVGREKKPMFSFNVTATCGRARAGVLHTSHGNVPTPVFLPVATQGSVKTVTPQELRALGATILLGNTYHLYLRPGVEIVRGMGGLATFMGWDGPTLTDSGGFQAYSLGSRVCITDDELRFRSHIDGRQHRFTPENAMVYQETLGADIVMALDQCIAYTEDKEVARVAMHRTHRWLAGCREAHSDADQALFGIVQGGVFRDLRQESAAYVAALDLPGYAIGGLAVGESKETMYSVVEYTVGLLPAEQPRHLLGVGSPEDLVECVGRGIDMFDCAMPTRVARNAALYTHAGRVNIDAATYRGCHGPVEEGCDCYTCRNFSVGYLHHLFRSGELLALRLATLHNLRFVIRLMEEMRAAIIHGSFSQYAEEFLARYQPTSEDVRMAQREKWLAARSRRPSNSK